jgi:hypothetical protein
MKSHYTTYQSYLLRLWCEKDGAGWRATLENVATHESHSFSNLLTLFEFLNLQTLQSTSGMDLDSLTSQLTNETQTPIYVEFFEEEVGD